MRTQLISNFTSCVRRESMRKTQLISDFTSCMRRESMRKVQLYVRMIFLLNLMWYCLRFFYCWVY